MFTDMVGYTALGQRNELLSLAMVDEQRNLIRPILDRHNGREVTTIGDAFMVEFPSALDAVRCGYDIQRTIREFNFTLPEDHRIHLRIGIHIGDVVDSAGDLSGDTVNVASRIEHVAGDGDVCLTQQVYDQTVKKFDLPIASVGRKILKNVTVPIEVYKIVMPWEKQPLAEELSAKRIAVLPFVSMSVDPSDSYFADGVTEEIISTVSNVGGLNVISRTSVMGYKGTTKSVREIGRELEVGSILEGSFRKSGNRIRVTAQLIDVGTDRHLWSQSYDRQLDDVITVQVDVARQVTDALRVRILPAEMDRVTRRPTQNTTAYTLYLRGRYMWNRRGKEDLEKAAGLFEQSIREDPGFALGYVGLASCYQLLSGQLTINYNTNHAKAKDIIEKALELDRNLAEAHAVKAIIMGDEYNLQVMREELEIAIALKPSYASAHQWYFLLALGELRWEKALEEIEKALELDPFSQIISLNYAGYYGAKKEYSQAVKLLEKTIELDPNSFLAANSHFSIAWMYGKMKMFENARQEAKKFVDSLKDAYPHIDKIVAAIIAYLEDDKETVRRLLPEAQNNLDAPISPAHLISGLYFYLGEMDEGFNWIEKAYSRLEPGLFFIKSDDMFDRARKDPRYLDILKRLGLQT